MTTTKHPRTAAIASRKGGVTKTTTSVNLAACLAEQGVRTCLVDLDPQGHATLTSGLHGPGPQGAHLLFVGEPKRLEQLATPSAYGFDVVRGGDDLLLADEQLAREQLDQYRLRDAIEGSTYDVVLIDCPGSFGRLTMAGLIAADFVLVPCTLDALAIDGLMQIDRIVKGLARRNVNPGLAIGAVLETQVNMRTDNARVMHAQLEQHAGGLLLKGTIRFTSYFQGANGAQMPITKYMPKSPGADDYRAAVRELGERGLL